MEILSEGEIEEMQNVISNVRLLLLAAQKRIAKELSVVDEWLRVLDFRLRYSRGEENED